jgi:hypothetical protein
MSKKFLLLTSKSLSSAFSTFNNGHPVLIVQYGNLGVILNSSPSLILYIQSIRKSCWLFFQNIFRISYFLLLCCWVPWDKLLVFHVWILANF